MIEVYADNEGKDYPSCPFRSDLNSCSAEPLSKVNDCPKYDEEGVYRFPEWCPLKKGGIFVKFKD